MRKMTLFIVTCVAALLLCAQAHANYRIELKSGRSIITSYYWEENGRIMFYQLGGVVGYPADQVERITDTDRPEPQDTPRMEPEVDEESSQDTGAAGQGEVEVPAELDMDSEEFQAKVEQYQEELRENLQERNVYFQEYEFARLREDETSMNDVEKKLKDLQEQRNNLRRNVLDIYQNIQPRWWDDMVSEHVLGTI